MSKGNGERMIVDDGEKVSGMVMRKDRNEVRAMFDDVATRYDFLNRLLSFGIDARWRRYVAGMVARHVRGMRGENDGASLLDVATGTGDFIIAMKQEIPKASIIGTDISSRMLAIARKKVSREENIWFNKAPAEALPFGACVFDAVTIGFGVRNFEDLDMGLSECFRVLKKGGGVFILEPMIPRSRIIRFFYMFYFRRVLPWIGGMLSRSKFAYKYFACSVEAFCCGEAFMDVMRSVGFEDVRMEKRTFETAVVYSGIKAGIKGWKLKE